MEYTVTLSLAEGNKTAEAKAKLEGAKGIHDLYAEHAAGRTLILITHDAGPNPLDAAGIKNSSISLKLFERPAEDLIALHAIGNTDYSSALARVYADPYNTPTLATNPRIAHGFKLEEAGTQRLYNTPEDLHKLLARLKEGLKISKVYKKTGEQAAAADGRLLLARVSEYYPTMEETLNPFKPSRAKTKTIRVTPVTLKNARISIDNTFKPKTVTLKK